MIKKIALKRIIISSLALVLVTIIYLFPTPSEKEEISTIPKELSYISKDLENTIYLLDQYEYVARTNVMINSETAIDKVKEIVETLTINSTKEDYIPNGFKAIIPSGTKINSLSLKDGLLKIDFSKELLSIKKEYESKMIEAIIYSLTTVDEVEEILIFVDGIHLNSLPNSNINMPNPLTRDFGINKIYDLDNIKNSSMTTIYYVSKYNDNYYYVPITKVTNEKKDKIEVIISELKSSPVNQTNLMSFLTSSAELLKYEVLENKINISFNNNLIANLSDNSILEEVKYTIGLSVKEAYDVDAVGFYVENTEIESFLIKNLE